MGEAVSLAAGVAPTFASSNQGAVAALPLGASDQADLTQLVWMNRAGRVEARIDQAAGAQTTDTPSGFKS